MGTFGKSLVLIGFFGYLALLAAAVHYQSLPTFDLRSPYVHFAKEPMEIVAMDEPGPIEVREFERIEVAIPDELRSREFLSAATEEKFGQTTETITYYPPLPIVSAPPVYTTWYPTTVVPDYTVSSPTYILPPPVIIRRPFFQAFIP